MSKPKEILELEEVYGITLEELKEKHYLMFLKNRNKYTLNSKKQLDGLNLHNNSIKNFEFPSILNSIEKLDISGNQIIEIKNLENLPNLEYLDISNNFIIEIENLEKLSKLKYLDISENEIEEIKNLDQLLNLEKLDISDNKIIEVKNLENLSKLKSLDISSNNIIYLNIIINLTNLQLLNAFNNFITHLHGVDKLSNLRFLDVSDNLIQNLEKTKSILKLPYLHHLKIHRNPFVEENNLILDIIENHHKIIKNELQKLQEKQISIQFPVKVMLLGNHASGKSTLLKYLQTQKRYKISKTKYNSTHVLSVEHSKELINHKLPKAIFYDFGGQDYYHGVYQAFFTQEAINLLIWNPKSDDNELLEKDSNNQPTRNYNRAYWLAQLQHAFLKRHENLENYSDPLLLVQTHADEYNIKYNWHEAFKKNHIVDEFHISLNIEYKSGKNEAALNYLTTTFWDTLTQQIEIKEVPEWYPEFLSYIINKKNPDAVSLKTIAKYYKRNSLSNEEKEVFLKEDLEQLARKGLLLYYKNDDTLNDSAWLNPSATVKYIHENILNKKIIEKHKGKLSKEDFLAQNINTKIGHLLLNEKVLFFDQNSQEYIIPNYLPLTSEDDEIYELLKFDFNKPTFVLKFERFIPFGLINQLICHYGQNPDKKYYWRDQLIFTLHGEFKVWIQLDFSRLTISVSIKSPTKKDQYINNYIYMIFVDILALYWSSDLTEIVETLVNPKTDDLNLKKLLIDRNMIFYKAMLEKLKKPNDLYISTDNKYFVHYNTLNDPDKTAESIPAYLLPQDKNDLDKTNVRTQRSYRYRNFTDNPNIQQMKKIFISYSRKDVEYKDELRKHLNMLKLFDVADNWSCEDITIGKWHDQIQKELEESDLVIFMLSINFFNSRYIIENEVLETMNSIANGKDKKVYCIIVSEFPRLEKFDKESMDETQQKILELGDYQFGMYIQEKNETTGNKEEAIISLKEAKRKGILDGQLTKITEKILEEVQKWKQ